MTLREVYVKGGIPSAKYNEQYFSNIRAPRSMGDAVHAFGLTLCRDRSGLKSTELRSKRGAVHSVPQEAHCVKLGTCRAPSLTHRATACSMHGIRSILLE